MREYSTFLQSSKIKASPSDGLESYLEHLFGGSCPSAEMQSVYSTSLGLICWCEIFILLLRSVMFLFHCLNLFGISILLLKSYLVTVLFC